MQKCKNALISLFFCSVISFNVDTWAAGYSKNTAENKSKFNLDEPTQARFKLTDRIWSKQYGDASVCTWKDDKLAALSITVDDNIPEEHVWWTNIGKMYDWSFTWFIIAHYIEENHSGFGTWSDFKKLFKLGHDIQSHSYDHYHYDDQRAESEVVQSYERSIRVIEKNIPGTEVVSLAYPNGRGNLNIAKKFFIASRGVVGRPNVANAINYRNTNAGCFTKEWIDNLITYNPIEGKFWRGWNVLCFHDVAKGNTLVEKKASLDSAMILFEYIHSRENEIWVENFTKVAKYAQQRDSHTLNVIDKDSQFIRLSLTDSLIDSIFSYPLTIKVPLSDSWNSICIAFQNGKIIPLSFVYHGGAYVLIQAIPDRGDIFLYKNPADSASFFKTSKSESRYRSGKKTVRMADTEKKASDNMINLMGKSVSPVKNKKSLRFLLTR